MLLSIVQNSHLAPINSDAWFTKSTSEADNENHCTIQSIACLSPININRVGSSFGKTLLR
jgi:hypothetical protein